MVIPIRIRSNIRAVLATAGIAIALAGTTYLAAVPARFVDNLDGTISDNSTGLMWEKKTSCLSPSENDPHCVNNVYDWAKSANDPDGALFTDFLTKINRADGGKKYSDWRIPNIDELKTIVDCEKTNCLDPTFGETQASRYWSSSRYAEFPDQAWTVNFFNGAVNFRNNKNVLYARAVRGPF